MASAPPKSFKQATWYFDVVSPFSYLALAEIERLAQSMSISYRPILFAALLEHWSHRGPAEIPPKRLHTYRLCVFEAQQRGIAFRFPPHHPFNPLKTLRLLVALEANPRAVRTVMDRIWRDGLDLSTEENWQATSAALGLAPAAAASLAEAPETKAKLRANTEAAIAAGLFGVPTLQIGDELFWGVDALPMARAYLDNPDIFESGEMRHVATIKPSAARAPT
ncbi:MAG TPA: 2-hydroxychromene-2-carboxylate isomerase [Bradyrhizobium sp.]|uniref:2-hydroxychromene-2-carboxylate isomerase n=1 Tax=Bradyrhizobium sp. TaxID=376 RepID=UPI002D7EB4F2|nr:2-hydroxychromene-2-carboxylate isomerase [Bradyrhizobium sp.]HET7885500.1 2-hydroxychromene-2-carboxylate isomerase [Bradyrhizobium sp.]